MAADRYFGHSPVEITKEDEKKYWRIKTTLPGTAPTHSCGNQELDIPQCDYTAHFRGEGCGAPAKQRYRYERIVECVVSEVHCDVEDAAEQLEDAAEHLEEGAEKLETAAEKLDDVVERIEDVITAPMPWKKS